MTDDLMKYSKQPRFKEVEPEDFYASVLWWTQEADAKAPKYLSNSKVRDAWLNEFWKKEPHLAGIVSSVVSIDANRGWSLSGGRNQVLRYTEVLHNWVAAPGMYGYRPGCSTASQSYYTTDLGSIIEVGREGKGGPLRALYSVDSTACRLTGVDEYPIKYKPQKGKEQEWGVADFLRCVSMISPTEKYNGLGICAISRCLELAQIMIAVYQHDMEQLGAQAPRGLLLLKGITESQWDDSMQVRKETMRQEGVNYYDSVQVLAGINDLDAKLVALSSLPNNFNMREFTALLIYGYSLCFNYDPTEFYPVQFGSLGRGTETEVQHGKATGKGGKNFAFALQEQIQRPDVLPPSLMFEYDERDDQGEITSAQVEQSWVNVYKTIRETGLQQTGMGGISNDEYRTLLAEKDIIPRDWTMTQEPSVSTDEGELDAESGDEENLPEPEESTGIVIPGLFKQQQKRDYLLSLPWVWHTIERFPNDAIVRYNSQGDKMSILWNRAETLLQRQTYLSAKLRQKESEVLYESGEVKITVDDVDRAIKQGTTRVGEEFGFMMNAQKYEGQSG